MTDKKHESEVVAEILNEFRALKNILKALNGDVYKALEFIDEQVKHTSFAALEKFEDRKAY